MTDQFFHDYSNNELENFGDGALAYVKQISHADAKELIGEMPDMPSNINLFCLFSANGTPLSISDSQALAFENAFEQDLETIALH